MCNNITSYVIVNLVYFYLFFKFPLLNMEWFCNTLINIPHLKHMLVTQTQFMNHLLDMWEIETWRKYLIQK